MFGKKEREYASCGFMDFEALADFAEELSFDELLSVNGGCGGGCGGGGGGSYSSSYTPSRTSSGGSSYSSSSSGCGGRTSSSSGCGGSVTSSSSSSSSESIRAPSSSGGGCGANISVPKYPSGTYFSDNVERAEKMSWKEFYNAVRNGGEWDYKQQGSDYEDFGNFNFGLTGAALGLPEEILLRGAGWAQQQAGTSDPEWGNWWGKAPYGDDPKDQEQIKAGIDYYNEYYRK